MQRCTYCGADLPDNARFCTNCGRVPPSVGAGNAQGQNDWNTVPDTSLAGAPPVSNQPSVDNMRQQQGSPAQGYAPQGPPWSAPAQNQAYPQQQQPPSGFAPPQVPPGFAQQQPPPGSGNPYPPQMQPPPAANAGTIRRGVLGLPLSVFIVALVCLVILVGVVGVAAYFLRSHPSGSPGVTGSPTSAAAPTTSGSTPTQGSTSTAVAGPTHLVFSGGVSGQMDVTTYQSCGTTNNNTQYNLTIQGKISGLQYNFFIRIAPYKGSGAYTTGQVFSGLSQQPVSITANWANTGNQSANASVNPGNKSGTLNVDLAGTTSTVHVAGNWNCP